jgi:ArsR family transcriptional regulator
VRHFVDMLRPDSLMEGEGDGGRPLAAAPTDEGLATRRSSPFSFHSPQKRSNELAPARPLFVHPSIEPDPADAGPGRSRGVRADRPPPGPALGRSTGGGEDSTLTNHATLSLKTRAAKSAPSGVTPIKISEPIIQRLTDVFKLLADKSRFKIVLALAQDRELHVSALCDLLGQSQPAVSHHLTLMRMVGLVAYRRDGKHNYYRLAPGHVRDLLEQFFLDSGNGQRQLQFEDFALSFKRR